MLRGRAAGTYSFYGGSTTTCEHIQGADTYSFYRGSPTIYVSIYRGTGTYSFFRELSYHIHEGIQGTGRQARIAFIGALLPYMRAHTWAEQRARRASMGDLLQYM
ncbi:hypothetical protein GDO78_021229 [Eleutherodactylus coqui]|uniref:Uncharacterized protein n=1 Tax=Eleutherodactylus coqui TaxID=57060 RepID=A0A8J6ENK3_ELECQ|nr:hypothetical protein GDO78_021229 [Eleutherodactylus coqui]